MFIYINFCHIKYLFNYHVYLKMHIKDVFYTYAPDGRVYIEDLTDKKAVKCQKYKSQKCYLKKIYFSCIF